MEHTLNLVVGDWSDDGHGKTDTMIIKCSHDSQAVKAAYLIGRDIVGFDFGARACVDYEESRLTEEHHNRLVAAGIIEYDVEIDPKDRWLEPRTFAKIWMRIAQKGNADITYEVVENFNTNINIGGYGLFW